MYLLYVLVVGDSKSDTNDSHIYFTASFAYPEAKGLYYCILYFLVFSLQPEHLFCSRQIVVAEFSACVPYVYMEYIKMGSYLRVF